MFSSVSRLPYVTIKPSRVQPRLVALFAFILATFLVCINTFMCDWKMDSWVKCCLPPVSSCLPEYAETPFWFQVTICIRLSMKGKENYNSLPCNLHWAEVNCFLFGRLAFVVMWQGYWLDEREINKLPSWWLKSSTEKSRETFSTPTLTGVHTEPPAFWVNTPISVDTLSLMSWPTR